MSTLMTQLEARRGLVRGSRAAKASGERVAGEVRERLEELRRKETR